MPTEIELIAERKRKLEEIRKRGINPYPYKYEPSHKSKEIHEKYDGLKTEEETQDSVKVAGRIIALRRMGKASFIHLLDSFGKIQLYISQDLVGIDKYKFLKLLDIGDWIGVEGIIFKTRTGEITVKISDYTLLCKSLRPLPEKWHGLKDAELRYRQRYIDLIVNPEVKEVFLKRAKIYRAIRDFLDEKGFIEIQTPILQSQYGGGNAKPFVTSIHAWDMPMYLRIAYELHLKRLLVGGFDKIYDLGSCFRNEGVDRTHNPEFAMMEIQWAFADYDDAMKLTEQLWEYVAKKVLGTTIIEYGDKKIDLKAPWKRISMKEALQKFADLDFDKLSDDEVKALISQHSIICGNTRGEMLMALFEKLCEDKLIEPTHVMDHPRESCPLAKPHRKDSSLIERVEPFINGWEVGNCYSELTDSVLQRKLLDEQVQKRSAGDEEAHPMDEDYINALEHGLPPNTGIGIGVDRMIMLLTNSNSIRDVILFPIMKKE